MPTIAICPTSTPTLNPTNAKASTPLGSLRSVRTLAKAKAIDQPEAEGHHPAPAADDWEKVVERREHHRHGNG
jgi:hypothetical protein